MSATERLQFLGIPLRRERVIKLWERRNYYGSNSYAGDFIEVAVQEIEGLTGRPAIEDTIIRHKQIAPGQIKARHIETLKVLTGGDKAKVKTRIPGLVHLFKAK